MVVRVEVDANLGRAILALTGAEAGTAEAMRESADNAITGTWQTALLGHASTALERRIMANGASADVTPIGFTLDAGLGGPVSGGLGSESWPAVEFGMTPFQSYDTKRRKTLRIPGTGREMPARAAIWVGKNLRPRNSEGYVALPTARQHGPKFVASWVYGLIGQFDDVNDTALEIGGN